MLKISAKISVILGGMILGLMITGCPDTHEESAQNCLIRVNDRCMTVDEFENRFNRMNADAMEEKPGDQGEFRRYLLNQMIEEFILLERAKELNLKVTAEELDRAVEEIRKDYPEGTFRAVLLEQAVSLTQWKKELKSRMLMEKVIHQELDPRITVSQADITDYYEKHYLAGEGETEDPPLNEDLSKTLFELVRNEKREKVYRKWIANLQQRYQIHINAAAWKRMNRKESLQ
jgi:peptidyl-prolyl cis-trans isomerase SurA